MTWLGLYILKGVCVKMAQANKSASSLVKEGQLTSEEPYLFSTRMKSCLKYEPQKKKFRSAQWALPCWR